MDINKISQKYDVRYLNKENVDEISKMMNGNQQFYKYTDSKPTKENILNDMGITPPGIDISQKYYIGFYESNELIAIMDLIDGYPSSDTAYIGFFMVNSKYQGKVVLRKKFGKDEDNSDKMIQEDYLQKMWKRPLHEDAYKLNE